MDTELPSPDRIIADLPTGVAAFYQPLGEGRYTPTIHLQGAWRPWEQHMAPVAGLITQAVMEHAPREDMQLSRITFEILGIIPAMETVVEVTTLRPGRTIELLEASATINGRVAIRARAWRVATTNTAEVSGHGIPELPSPDSLGAWRGMNVWGGGFIDAVEFREVPGHGPGRGRAWLRTDIQLVEGQKVHPEAAVLGLSDTANGIGPREEPRQWMFPNVELSVHLFRAPKAGWVGLDGTVAWGPTGAGLTSTWLHDIHGPVGRIEQSLTVRPMPEAL